MERNRWETVRFRQQGSKLIYDILQLRSHVADILAWHECISDGTGMAENRVLLSQWKRLLTGIINRPA